MELKWDFSQALSPAQHTIPSCHPTAIRAAEFN